MMCRGIGDPLVGAYARSYIVHVGLRCKPKETKYIVNAVEDLVTSCKWKLLKQIENSKSTAHYVIIKTVLETFPATDLCLNYKVILQGLDLCFSHGEKPHETLITLADVATKCPPSEEDKFDVLNGAWQLVVRINPAYNHYYLKTATAWLKFTANNFPIRDVDKILGDVLRRLSKSTSANHTFYIPLLSLLTCALSSAPFTEELYTLSSFRSLLSIFQRESVGSVGSNNVGELRKLIEAVIQYHREEFSDLSVVQLLLSLFATLHDGINALTTQDEKRQITYLVNTFIRKVNYGKDFELQLQFYVDARSVFSSLDPVLASLIQHVLRLQMLTYHVVAGHHTGKTAAFERACSAYCFITIPSLSCPISRIKLYMLTGAIAMINNCMGQGDACVKSAVKTILEIPQAFNDSSVPMDEILRTISYVSSFLVAFPDPPDAVRPLYLFRGLEKSLKSLEGILTPSAYCSLNLAVLKGVCSCAMSSLPYHFIKVDGNDILYGGGPDMKAEAEDICTELLSNVLASLKELIGLSDALQVDILCELLEIILQNGDLSDEKLNNLAVSLLTLINNISPNTKLKKNLKLMFEKKKKNEQ
ncbi:hypothetical protein Anas_00611 [Armadillidium nasatum]|uniref:Uncharacterized protein n=1 Tax=Armadillidium nasatum TaxID=96803 RepID=A0A5N5TP96_9CRUS|nr:hypothetical protein Anas_00611 [Armadillidium nasatum]